MPNPNYKPSITIKKRNLTITPKNPPQGQYPNTDFNSLYMTQGRIAQDSQPGLLGNLGNTSNPYKTA